MLTERKHDLSAEKNPVTAYVESSKNLEDLKGFGLLEPRFEKSRVFWGLSRRTPQNLKLQMN